MVVRSEEQRIDAELTKTELSSDPFVSAVRATRMPMLITDPRQPDNPIIFSNDAFTKLTGYSREEVLGKNCRFLQGELTDKSDVTRIHDAIKRRIPIELDLLNYKKDHTTFWNRLLISPVFSEAGQLTHFFASQFDVTLERERLVRLRADRDQLEKEVQQHLTDLTESEDRLRLMLKAARVGSWTLSLPDCRLIASDICKENFGRLPSEPFDYPELIASIDPEDRKRMQEAVRKAIERHEEYDIEYRIITPSHERRWVLVRGSVNYTALGEPKSMAGISMDITDRKLGEEHRSLLTAELNHRVKNSMATMQAIAHQTLRNSASVTDARVALDGRLQSLAAAHDVLTRESWEGANLSELFEGALRPFGEIGHRIVFGGPHVRVSPAAALSLMLALHELATNAAKYGALSNDLGRVIINWDTNLGAGGNFMLRWQEIDGPQVQVSSKQGFGSVMINRVLSRDLGGRANFDFAVSGLVFTFEAPRDGAIARHVRTAEVAAKH